jgi:UDP-glucose 4-epimerase
VTIVEGDIRDRQCVAEAVEGIDFVFHKAAPVSVFDSVQRPLDNHEINLTGTLNVLEGAKEAGVKRVVLASSAAIYGNGPELPKVEAMRPQPESPYTLANIANEHYGRVFSKLYSLPVISLRYFNVYGPRQDPHSPYSGAVSQFVDILFAVGTPTIFGDGTQSRDFVFVKDVVRANLLAMHTTSLKGGEVFNVATGERTSLLGLLESVQRIAGVSGGPTFRAERTGDIKHSLADISLAKHVLDFHPTFTLHEGLESLISWSRNSK